MKFTSSGELARFPALALLSFFFFAPSRRIFSVIPFPRIAFQRNRGVPPRAEESSEPAWPEDPGERPSFSSTTYLDARGFDAMHPMTRRPPRFSSRARAPSARFSSRARRRVREVMKIGGACGGPFARRIPFSWSRVTDQEDPRMKIRDEDPTWRFQRGGFER
jgi:hypothetical protein